MRNFLTMILWATFAIGAIYGALAFFTSLNSNSAIHEIESLLGALIVAASMTGHAVVSMMPRPAQQQPYPYQPPVQQ